MEKNCLSSATCLYITGLSPSQPALYSVLTRRKNPKTDRCLVWWVYLVMSRVSCIGWTLTYSIANYRWHQSDWLISSNWCRANLNTFPTEHCCRSPYTSGSPQWEPVSLQSYIVVEHWEPIYCISSYKYGLTFEVLLVLKAFLRCEHALIFHRCNPHKCCACGLLTFGRSLGGCIYSLFKYFYHTTTRLIWDFYLIKMLQMSQS